MKGFGCSRKILLPSVPLSLIDPLVSPMQILVPSFMILKVVFIILESIKAHKWVGFMVLCIEYGSFSSLDFILVQRSGGS